RARRNSGAAPPSCPARARGGLARPDPGGVRSLVLIRVQRKTEKRTALALRVGTRASHAGYRLDLAKGPPTTKRPAPTTPATPAAAPALAQDTAREPPQTHGASEHSAVCFRDCVSRFRASTIARTSPTSDRDSRNAEGIGARVRHTLDPRDAGRPRLGGGQVVR